MIDVKNIIKKLFDKNSISSPVIIEAGAAEGNDTYEFSVLFPSATIYSFEPIKVMYEMAKNKTKDQTNVVLYNKALSDKNCITTMHVADRYGQPWGSHSLMNPKLHVKTHPAITFKSEEMVETIILDDFIKNNKISIIDFMWLDMQGSEPNVLMKSIESLKKTRYLYTEVSLEELYEGTVLYPEYKKFLESNGFEVVFEDLPWTDGGNVLFRNTRI